MPRAPISEDEQRRDDDELGADAVVERAADEGAEGADQRQDDAEQSELQRTPAEHRGAVDAAEGENGGEAVGVDHARDEEEQHVCGSAAASAPCPTAPPSALRPSCARFCRMSGTKRKNGIMNTRYQTADSGPTMRSPSRVADVEREQRVEPEHRLARIAHGGTSSPATRNRLARPPKYPHAQPAPGEAAELGLRHEARHDGVGENGGVLGARRRDDEGEQHEIDRGHRRAGCRDPQRGHGYGKHGREQGDPRLALAATVGKGAEKRTADGDEDAGHGRRVAPHRLALGVRCRRRRWRNRARRGTSGSACRTAAPTNRTASTRCAPTTERAPPARHVERT